MDLENLLFFYFGWSLVMLYNLCSCFSKSK